MRDVDEAIQELEGVKLCVLGVAREFHAVMSPCNSAVTGWEFVDCSWFDDACLKLTANWELDLIETRRKFPLPSQDPIEDMIGVMM